MSLASDFFISLASKRGHDVQSWTPLTATDALNLKLACEQDAKNFVYSSVISFSEALRGIQHFGYSWATIKLYYSVYYSVASLLSFGGYAICYQGKRPYLLVARAGHLDFKLPKLQSSGGSHGSTLAVFATKFSSHPINLQEIGGISALNWMKLKREGVNYKNPKFDDPTQPKWFNGLSNGGGLRRCLGAYLQDYKTYSFDEDHAILAFPLFVLQQCLLSLQLSADEVFSEEDRAYLLSLICDSAGPINSVCQALRVAR